MPNGVNAVLLGGLNALAEGVRSIAGGWNARARGAGSVVIGANAKDAAVGGASDVVIGDSAEAGVSGSATIGNGEAVAIGSLTKAWDWRGTAVGAKAVAGAISATALGRGARAMHSHGVAIGRGAFTSALFQSVIGQHGTAPHHIHFNNAHTSRFIEPTDGGITDRDPLLSPILLHGMSGFDSTPTPIPDRPGGDVVLAGGQSTGTAVGGRAVLAVCPAGAVSGASENALVDAFAALPSGDVEVLLPGAGCILASPNGARWRLTVSDSGVLQVAGEA